MATEKWKYKSKYIPKNLKNIDGWKLSRRSFLGSLLAGGAVISLPSFSTFSQNGNKSFMLSESQFALMSSVQKILFPSDNNGPGAYDIMADRYLLWVLSDKRMDPEEIEYIINGIGWVGETAEENFSKSYTHLSQKEKEILIANISNESWGSSWLSVILTFIFEALLSDPQYGGNPDQIGWDWLYHNPGYPRPTERLLYPEILITVE